MMSKGICMFVWNHFTNDARVMRECSALAEAGYEVDLIAIHDFKNPHLPRFESRKEGYSVYRVRSSFRFLSVVAGIANRLKRHLRQYPILITIPLGLALAGLFFIPLWTCSAMIACALVLPRKSRGFINKSLIFLQMVRLGLKKKYDLYHSNDLNTLPQGYLCSRIWRKSKLVYDSHEVQTSRTGYNSPIYGMAERFLVKRVDVMIAENHTRAKYTEQLYGIYPNVVHNYPEISRPEESSQVNLHELLDIPLHEPILLYQGGIQIGRGLDKIIKAVPLFDRGVVVMIGDGKIKPELVAMVRERGLEQKVRFLPKVPVEDLLHYTKNAYLGFQVLNNICFNHYSASSNKLFEYMMSGVPVVACSFPEIQRVVEGEQIGVCVDSHSPESIAGGVNRLLGDVQLYKSGKENSLKSRQKFNWKSEKESFIKIYKEVII
ncbi:glycosyltransferase [Paenibacillus humicus]|uniref:glycosyltransferase n=1 Tax=Paenibacillus humicus TaxID=412861 RepID=UPI000FD777E3|nr:glycosyltransferase [Paenibacillus humicus]